MLPGRKFIKYFITGVLFLVIKPMAAQLPVVENVRFEQRNDGSLLVDIYYDVTTAGDLPLKISVEASGNDGASWDLPCSSLSGDIGEYISEGADKHVLWDFYADNPDTSGTNYRVRVKADCMICGQTLSEDFTLTEDLNCPESISPYISIKTSHITLDLGGYTITGDIDKGSQECIVIDNATGVKIRNGTIDGFIGGIINWYSDSTIIENMKLRNMDIDDPLFYIAAIGVSESRKVLVRECQFEFLPVHHKCGINMANSNVNIENIEIINGGTGIDFGGSMDAGSDPSSGSVSNCTLNGAVTAGILFHYADSVTIENNVLINKASIYTDPGIYGGVRRLLIKNNDISGAFIGVLFNGTIDSEISGNNIHDNVSKGIALLPNVDCGNPDIECFYSTNNIISDNILHGNGIDLYHDEGCLGNTWINNTYETAEGSEIYNYGPSTAKEFLSSVDSTARTVAADAQLRFVTPFKCDTTGRSMRWIYIYQSVSEQRDFEFWVNDGRVIQRDSVSISWMYNDGFMPFSESWIDSDSAIALAENMGGKAFREQNEIDNIEMNLYNTFAFVWTVRYITQSTSFVVDIDATLQ